MVSLAAVGCSNQWWYDLPTQINLLIRDSGKTVLSTSIIESLLQEGRHGATAYFYFDFNDKGKQYYDKMLRSLVIQLTSSKQLIPEPLNNLFEACGTGVQEPQSKELEQVLKALINPSSGAFLVLDAMDECEDYDALMLFLEDIMTWGQGKLNVAVTSRRLKRIEDFFQEILDERNMIAIQSKAVDNDVRSFVRKSLTSDKRFKRWQTQTQVQTEIEEKLMDKCDGM